MSANFEIATETVKVRNGSFTVRGLNSEDVTALVTGYYDDIAKIIDRFGQKAKNGQVESSTVVELALDMAGHFPILVAEIISRSADAHDQIDKFRSLTFIKQLEALRLIAQLTVEDGHELKKLGEVLASLLEVGGNIQLGPLATALQTIIKRPENQSAI